MDILRFKLGSRWAYRFRERILLTKLEIYPSPELAREDMERIQAREAKVFDAPPSGELTSKKPSSFTRNRAASDRNKSLKTSICGKMLQHASDKRKDEGI